MQCIACKKVFRVIWTAEAVLKLNRDKLYTEIKSQFPFIACASVSVEGQANLKIQINFKNEDDKYKVQSADISRILYDLSEDQTFAVHMLSAFTHDREDMQNLSRRPSPA